MNEFLTGLLVLTSELSAVLLLGAIVLLVVMIRRQRKHRRLALELINRLRDSEAERRQKLVALLTEHLEMDAEQADARARSMLKCETSLYSHVLSLFMGRDPEQLLQVDHDVERLVRSYYHLLEEEEDDEGDAERESLIVKLKRENKQLRDEKNSLQKNLETTMETMENMMDEYASMYEGGHKEGEQRLKNEMFKLQQKISKVVSSDNGEEQPAETDGEEEIPELDSDAEEPKPNQ
ncbi:MAG: hypothetical protein RI563_01320 [Thiohalophilus sp.]|uniref:hypothetical protein n=1 Tax=Thiohalophilus sp. TaxID=3028392 RepID=UPI0028700895|nr:hypothetical protein [Thiohalophilus sp.]MDR9435488.1 hypothetical protein [Thiohalophilus sp.]